MTRASAPAHRCTPPTRGTIHPVPTGQLGDLWRCDCRRVWRIGRACNACEHYDAGSHDGQHLAGTAWRPATLWQRLTFRSGA